MGNIFRARAEGLGLTGSRAGAPAGKDSWFRIVNLGADEAEVWIYDEIGFWGKSAGDFVDELSQIPRNASLHVRINSPGGEVFDGIAIHSAISGWAGPTTVTVDGLAASAASFIAMAGDTVRMARNAQMMIHDPFGLCVGNAADLRELAERLDGIGNNVADIYAQKAGGTEAEWRSRMLAETWYRGPEALAAGLVDEVVSKPGPPTTEDPELANRMGKVFDLSRFRYRFADRAEAPAPVLPDTTEDAPDTQESDSGSLVLPFNSDMLRQALEGAFS